MERPIEPKPFLGFSYPLVHLLGRDCTSVLTRANLGRGRESVSDRITDVAKARHLSPKPLRAWLGAKSGIGLRQRGSAITQRSETICGSRKLRLTRLQESIPELPLGCQIHDTGKRTLTLLLRRSGPKRSRQGTNWHLLASIVSFHCHLECRQLRFNQRLRNGLLYNPGRTPEPTTRHPGSNLLNDRITKLIGKRRLQSHDPLHVLCWRRLRDFVVNLLLVIGT